MRKVSDTPLYVHDCSTCCEFLGTYASGHTTADLYCHKGSIENTVIQRYSSDGPDYGSGIVFGADPSNELAHFAVKESLRLGYLTHNDVILEMGEQRAMKFFKTI